MAKRPAKSTAQPRRRLTKEEFVLLAIRKLAQPKYPGRIHTVFTGFNAAFREYFPDGDPVQTVTRLAEQGLIACRPSKKGAVIWVPKKGDKPASLGAAALAKMKLS